jgi:hypothetical protein
MLKALSALRPATLRAPSPVPLPRVAAALAGPSANEPHGQPEAPASARKTPLLAALLTFVCTAAALAYALLR